MQCMLTAELLVWIYMGERHVMLGVFYENEWTLLCFGFMIHHEISGSDSLPYCMMQYRHQFRQELRYKNKRTKLNKIKFEKQPTHQICTVPCSTVENPCFDHVGWRVSTKQLHSNQTIFLL